MYPPPLLKTLHVSSSRILHVSSSFTDIDSRGRRRQRRNFEIFVHRCIAAVRFLFL
jgi:hypothetical protein